MSLFFRYRYFANQGKLASLIKFFHHMLLPLRCAVDFFFCYVYRCVYLNFQRIVLAINHFLLFLYRQNFAVSSSSSNGAVLFCVVGGKMSEGINFSDDLGR